MAMLQSYLQMECSTYENTQALFHRTKTNNPKIDMGPQKAELPKQSWEK